jgi:hypothetical protein
MENFEVGNIIGVFLIISVLSVVAITVGVLLLGTGNDYALGTMYDITEDMVTDGIITDSRVISQSEDINATALSWFGYIDYLWLLAYVAMSIALFLAAYFSKRLDFFTFSNLMYIGVFLLLFVLDFMYIATLWLRDEFLFNVLPTASTLVPKFMYFLDNLGIILSIQLALCFVLNVIDFNVIAEKFRKGKEQQALSREEVL